MDAADQLVDQLRRATKAPAPVVGVVTAVAGGTATVTVMGRPREHVTNPVGAVVGDAVEVSTRGVWTILRVRT